MRDQDQSVPFVSQRPHLRAAAGVPDGAPEQLEFPGIGSVPEDRYGHDPFGALVGLEGAGPLALMTRDQLHPLLVDDVDIWVDGRRWYEGAVAHTIEAADLLELAPGMKVLDVGAGLGGPARTLVERHDVDVIALNKVERQMRKLVELSRGAGGNPLRIVPVLGDADVGLPVRRVDRVWSMNMLYHLRDHDRLLGEIRRVLAPGGLALIDDWMWTDRTSSHVRDRMAFHFGSSNLASVRSLLRAARRADLRVVDIRDLGIVARTTMADNFRETFDRDFRPAFEELDPEWGVRTAEDFAAAIDETIEFYVAEELTYAQVVFAAS